MCLHWQAVGCFERFRILNRRPQTKHLVYRVTLPLNRFLSVSPPNKQINSSENPARYFSGNFTIRTGSTSRTNNETRYRNRADFHEPGCMG